MGEKCRGLAPWAWTAQRTVLAALWEAPCWGVWREGDFGSTFPSNLSAPLIFLHSDLYWAHRYGLCSSLAGVAQNLIH